MIKTIIGSILGGILVFGWGLVSWTVLKMHDSAICHFKDEAAVVAALKTQIDQDGIYSLPLDFNDESIRKGPFIFASIRQGEKANYSILRQCIRALTASIVAAIILGIMLHFAAPQLNFFGRLVFVTLAGVFVALAGIYPNNIWWEFSVPYTLRGIIDSVIGWFCGGLIMAAMVRGPKSRDLIDA